MMEFDAFSELVAEIMAQGFDENTAAYYAARIGDIPIIDAQGNVVVQDESGHTIARLKPLKALGLS